MSERCYGRVVGCWLWLSYHRRLRMISEAFELRVEGRRVSHSRCMGVVGNGYGGLGRCRDGDGGW